MLVTTAITGFRRRKLPSLSSASATSQSPPPRPRVGAGGQQLAADHEGRVEPAFGQHAGGQRGGGGLAVGAGDRHAALEAHQLGQHLRARHHRDALRARLQQLGVVRLDRAGHHHAVGLQHVGGGMAAMDDDAERRQPPGHGVVGVVGTGRPGSPACASPRRCRSCRRRRCRRNARAAAPWPGRRSAAGAGCAGSSGNLVGNRGQHRLGHALRGVGRASARAACAIARRLPGSAERSASACCRRAASCSVCGSSTAAPRSTRYSALRVWWSSTACGNGTSTLPTPTAHSSARVSAPARHTTRSAQAYAAAMSAMKGSTRASTPASA